MTRIRLTHRSGAIVRVEAEGHSGYADAGADIVCAAVTASFRLICAQLDLLPAESRIEQDERRAYLSVSTDDRRANLIFEGFAELMRELSDEYPENISVMEVEQNA